jgi:hypothetical protein
MEPHTCHDAFFFKPLLRKKKQKYVYFMIKHGFNFQLEIPSNFCLPACCCCCCCSMWKGQLPKIVHVVGLLLDWVLYFSQSHSRWMIPIMRDGLKFGSKLIIINIIININNNNNNNNINNNNNTTFVAGS